MFRRGKDCTKYSTRLVQDEGGAAALSNANSAAISTTSVGLSVGIPCALRASTIISDVETEDSVGGWCVGKDRGVGQASFVAETQVHGCKVTQGLVATTPSASSCLEVTRRVNVVLSRGGLSFPLVVGISVGVGKRNGLSGVDTGGEGFTLSTFKKKSVLFTSKI
jgi:hypothetical protein